MNNEWTGHANLKYPLKSLNVIIFGLIAFCASFACRSDDSGSDHAKYYWLLDQKRYADFLLASETIDPEEYTINERSIIYFFRAVALMAQADAITNKSEKKINYSNARQNAIYSMVISSDSEVRAQCLFLLSLLGQRLENPRESYDYAKAMIMAFPSHSRIKELTGFVRINLPQHGISDMYSIRIIEPSDVSILLEQLK